MSVDTRGCFSALNHFLFKRSRPCLQPLLVASLLAAPALGFAAPAANPEVSAEEQSVKRQRNALEEVVVTAQKREEDIQSVPLSVTAISGDDIVDKNMADMNEVAVYVPNLDVLATPSFPSIYMRGLGSSYNRGFEQSVALLIDDVYYGRASYINQATMDLVREIGFDQSFSFIYSQRPGTPAASFPDDVPLEVKKQRLEELQSTIDAQARDAWLDCMAAAVARQDFEPGFGDYLLAQLAIPADRIRQVCARRAAT